MKHARIPGDVLAAEIRSGNVNVDVKGTSSFGLVGGAVGSLAAEGFKKAGQKGQMAVGLRFPPFCCNCLASGNRVRSIESVSIANRVVAYTFRFRIPHCPGCADTANRKRAGSMGMFAAFLVVSVLTFIIMLGVGSATNRDEVIFLSVVVAPALGIVLPYSWTKLHRKSPGQASRYQAVYASALDVDFSSVPQSFTLAFENDKYADHFIALNKDSGVTEIRSK